MKKFRFGIVTTSCSIPFSKIVEAETKTEAWLQCVQDLDGEKLETIQFIPEYTPKQ